MAKINFAELSNNARPTYTVVAVGIREVNCSLSTGGTKSFTKSWLMELGKKGELDMDANVTPDGALVWDGATFKFIGTVEREF